MPSNQFSWRYFGEFSTQIEAIASTDPSISKSLLLADSFDFLGSAQLLQSYTINHPEDRFAFFLLARVHCEIQDSLDLAKQGFFHAIEENITSDLTISAKINLEIIQIVQSADYCKSASFLLILSMRICRWSEKKQSNYFQTNVCYNVPILSLDFFQPEIIKDKYLSYALAFCMLTISETERAGIYFRRSVMLDPSFSIAVLAFFLTESMYSTLGQSIIFQTHSVAVQMRNHPKIHTILGIRLSTTMLCFLTPLSDSVIHDCKGFCWAVSTVNIEKHALDSKSRKFADFAVNQDQNNPNFHMLRCQHMLAMEGEQKIACKFAEIAIQSLPKKYCPDFISLYAENLVALNCHITAVKQFNKLKIYRQLSSEQLLLLAKSLFTLGNNQKALKAFLESRELDKFQSSKIMKAEGEIQSTELSPVTGITQSSVIINTTISQHHILKDFQNIVSTLSFTQTMPIWKQSLEKTNTSSDSLLFAEFLNKMGEDEKCFEELMKAHNIDQNNFQVRYFLGEMLFKAKKYLEAKMHFEICAKMNADYKNIYLMLAQISLALEPLELSQAQNLLLKEGKINKKSYESFYLLGKIQMELGNVTNAIKTYGRCIPDPNFKEEAFRNLSRLYQIQGNQNSRIRLMIQWEKQFKQSNNKLVIMIAENYYFIENFQMSDIYIQKGLAFDPTDIEIIHLKGINDMKRRLFEQASLSFQQELELSSHRNWWLHFHLARCYLECKNLPQTQKHLIEGMKENDTHVLGLVICARVKIQQNKYKEAKDLLKKSLRLSDWEAETYFYLARVYDFMRKEKQEKIVKNEEKAIMHYKVAAQKYGSKHEGYIEAKARESIIYFKRKEFQMIQETLQPLNPAMKPVQKVVKFYLIRGYTYKHFGQFTEALEFIKLAAAEGSVKYLVTIIQDFLHIISDQRQQDYFIKLIDLGVSSSLPESVMVADLHYLLGVLILSDGQNIHLALDPLQKCLKQQPNHLGCQLTLAEYHIVAHDGVLSSAKNLLEQTLHQVIENTQSEKYVYHQLLSARYQQKLGNIATSIASLTELKTSMQASSNFNTRNIEDVDFWIGRSYLESKDYMSALAVLQPYETSLRCLHYSAVASEKSKNYTQAKVFIMKAIQIQQFDPSIRLHGIISLHLSNFKEAILFLKEYLSRALLPDAEAKIMKAQAHIEIGQYDLAITDLIESLKIDPIFPQTNYFLAKCYFTKELYSEALTAINRELLQEPLHIDSIYIRGVSQMKTGDFEGSIESLLKCEQSDDNNETYKFSLGEAYWYLGSKEKARDCFRSCVAKNPKHFNALFYLGEFYMSIPKGGANAEEYYLKCLAIIVNSEKVLLQIIKLIREGQSKVTLETFAKKYADNINTSFTVMLKIAEAYVEKSSKDPMLLISSKEYFKKIVDSEVKKDLNLKVHSPIALLRLAQVAYFEQKFIDSENLLQQSLVMVKSNPKAKLGTVVYLEAQLLKAQLFITSYNEHNAYERNRTNKFIMNSLQIILKTNKKQPSALAAQAAYLLIHYEDPGKAARILSTLPKTLEVVFSLESKMRFDSIMKANQHSLEISSTRENDLRRLIYDISEKLKLHPNSMRGHLTLADCYFQINSFTKAEQAYIHCSTLMTKFQDSLSSLPLRNSEWARCYYQIACCKQSQLNILNVLEAEVALVKAFSIHSEFPAARSMYADLLFKLKRIDEAIIQAKLAVLQEAHAPTQFITGEMVLLIGKTYLNRMLFDQANPYLRKAKIAFTDTNKINEIDMLLSRSLQRAKKYIEAVKELLPSIKDDGSNPEALIKSFNILSLLENHDLALTLADRYLKSCSAKNIAVSAEIQIAISYSQLRAGKNQEAQQTLEAVVAVSQPNFPATFTLANIYSDIDDHRAVVRLCQQFTLFLLSSSKKEQAEQESFDNAFVIHNLHGNALIKLNDLEAAEDQFLTGIAMKPDDDKIAKNHVIVLIQQAKYAEALERLEKVRKDDESLFLHALVLERQAKSSSNTECSTTAPHKHHFTAAIKMYQRSLRVNPVSIPAALNLAQLCMQSNLHNEAIAALRPLSLTFPKQIAIAYAFAQAHIKAGNIQTALTILHNARNTLNDQGKDRVNYSHISRMSNKESLTAKGEFIVSYRQRGLSEPDLKMVNLLISRAYRTQNRIDLELMHLEKCLFDDPNNHEYIFNQATAMFIAGMSKQAIAKFYHCIDLDPKRSALYLVSLSNIFNRSFEHDREITSLKKAIKLAPNYVVAHDNLGAALFRKKKYILAKESFIRSAELAPERADVHFNLGNVQLAIGEINAAIDCYNACLKRQKTHVKCLNNLAIAHSRLGDLDSAINCYETCIEIHPYDRNTYQDLLSKLHKRKALIA